MRKLRLSALLILTMLPFVAAASTPSAGARTNVLTNRFAPSGNKAVYNTKNPAVLKFGGTLGIKPSPNSNGCSNSSATNVRANQECTNQDQAGVFGRGASQNETVAAVNPTDPKNVLLAQNDYSFGDGKCGVDWSTDGGQHWGSRILPINFTPGFTALRHYWTSSGDPSVAFDSEGTAYYICGAFDRGGAVQDVSACPAPATFCGSGLFLFRSEDRGASWGMYPGTVMRSSGSGADGIGLLDKQYMTIDTSSSSPFKDRIYVTWSQFSPTFAADPITLAFSDDHGSSWHQTGAISGFDLKLCPINFSGAPPGTCDSNQFSDPFTAPNGDVYVAFQNFNNCAGALRVFGIHCPGDKNDNHNQMLIVKSTDGGNTFGGPVKVTNFYDLPDCVTYTGESAFRACVPTAPASHTSVFRAENYPSGVALSDTRIVVDFGSYLNVHSNETLGNCAPNAINPGTGLNKYTGVGVVNGCNNDIVRSVSVNGGASFTGTTTDPRELPAVSNEGTQLADQWWQWTAKAPNGRAVTSYYDRQYGTDMATGFMDLTLFNGSNKHIRVTDASMPPGNDFPGIHGFSTFFGDYSGLAVGSDGVAHPVWMDNRNPLFSFDPSAGGDPRVLFKVGFQADIYTASIKL